MRVYPLPLLLFFSVFLWLPFQASAQITLDTTVVLPDVTVTATRNEMTTASAPARVTVIDAESITSAGADNIADVLSYRSGAFIKRYGESGLATISLRGTSASQTAILLDDHRLTDPQLGQVDLSLLPAILFESVEVMHGSGSSLYGTDAVGGVVNLRTHVHEAVNSIKMTAGIGAFGEYSGGLSVTGQRGDLSGKAVLELTGSQGDFPFINEALFPPREIRRAGADRTSVSAYASGGFERLTGTSRASIWYAQAERGLPGLATTPPRGERQWDQHFRFWVDHNFRSRWGTTRLTAVLHQGVLRYLNPFLQIDDTGRTLLSTVTAEQTFLPGTRWLITSGATANYSQANHPQLSSHAREYHSAVYLSGTGSYGSLLFYPALRLDGHFMSGGRDRLPLSPRFGINWHPAFWRSIHLKANMGRAFRMPTFNDRYWQPGGNPDLRPEHGWTYDGGLYLLSGFGQLELTAFGSRIKDQIIWDYVSANLYTPDNVSRVNARGVEVSYRGRLALGFRRYLSGDLFYTFTDARDRSDPESPSYNQPVRYIPRDQFSAHLGYGHGPLHLDLNTRYYGGRYLTSDATQVLEPFLVLDAQIRLNGRLGVFLAQVAFSIENLLDAEYTVVPHYPMPPRHARIKLLIQTNPEGS